jgi:16S rRNA processing protein RimM
MVLIDEWVVIGKFGRPNGIKGCITVISCTKPRENVLQYTDWHININQQWQPVTLLNSEITHKSILTYVDGYADREQVAALTNVEIGVLRSQLSALPANEFYWHQLIGMKVLTVTGEELGLVDQILPTGSNDVLVVQGEKRCLIPYLLGDVVREVRLDQNEIIVDWEP